MNATRGEKNNSVEGSTIIIACSIPILQPLLDIVLKRNPLSSKRSKMSSDRYAYYHGDHRGQSGSGAAMELSAYNKLKHSKRRDDLGFTILDENGKGSQDNILDEHTNGSVLTGDYKSTASNEAGPVRNETNSLGPNHVPEGIRRTQVVTVSYSNDGLERDRNLALKSMSPEW